MDQERMAYTVPSQHAPVLSLVATALVCFAAAFWVSRAAVAGANPTNLVQRSLTAAHRPLLAISIPAAAAAVPANPAVAAAADGSLPPTSQLWRVAEDAAGTPYAQYAGLAALVVAGLFLAWQLVSKDANADAAGDTPKASSSSSSGRSSGPIATAGNVQEDKARGLALIRGLSATSPQGWKIQADELKARGVKSISAQELARVAKSAVIVDVRRAQRFQESSIPGSINVPLFQPIQGWDAFRTLRRIQFAVFAIEGTEYNPNFLEELVAKVPRQKELIFVDDNPLATLEPSTSFPDGKPGHAMLAMYRAIDAGYRNKMRYLEGGIGAYESS